MRSKIYVQVNNWNEANIKSVLTCYKQWTDDYNAKFCFKLVPNYVILTILWLSQINTFSMYFMSLRIFIGVLKYWDI